MNKRRGPQANVEGLESRWLFSRIIYVDVSAGPSIGGNGVSWDTAYTTLSRALSAGMPGDEIWVADGTYKPVINGGRNSTFALESGVKVLGGFAGKGAPDPNARDIAANRTILSGDIGTPGVYTDNTYHVVTTSGVDSSAVLDGFVITAGNADGSGGGLYNIGGSPTISRCTFTGNRASSHGGAIFNSDSAAPLITDCLFTGNFANTGGAGIANLNNSSPTISGSTFQRNWAYEGAGIFNSYNNTTAIVSNCSFTDNAGWSGGGIFLAGGTIDVSGCTFLRNTVGYQGGGMTVYGNTTTASIRNSSFLANTALNGGGLNTAFAQNANVVQCAFVGNVGQAGSAAYLGGGGTFVNNTVTGNGAPNPYASPHALNIQNFAGQIINSIVWDNLGASLSSNPANGATITYSDVQNGVAGTGNQNSNPNFMRAASSGADGVWGTPDDDFGDLRMRSTSQAIDAGSDAAVPAGLSADLAGAARFVDKSGAGSPTTTVDMGAYETQPVMAAIFGRAALATGQKTQFSAVGSIVSGAPLTYHWDLDADGQFDDAIGPLASLSAGSLIGPKTVSVSVRGANGSPEYIVVTKTIQIVPSIVHVDPRAVGGTDDGSNWTNARRDLPDALADSVSGQEIRIATGVYTPSSIGDSSASFALRNDVKIRGGYAGLGAADPDVRDFTAFATVFSGDIGAPNAKEDNTLRVVDGSNVNSTATLEGVTVTAGNADGRIGTSATNSGGGMYINRGSPTVRNVTFLRNTATSGGGVSLRPSSSPKFYDCTFAGNVATSTGGAMSNLASSPTLVNCVIVGNTANFSGAALHNDGANYPGQSFPVVINSTLTGNVASDSAVSSQGSALTVANSIVWGNNSANGGAITPISHGATVSYSDVQGGYTGNANIDADPQFVRSPSRGADNVWGTTDDDYGDLRLQMTSSCVDSGNNTAVPAGVSADRAGQPRYFDFPGVSDPGAIVDRGALELNLRLGLLHVPDGQTLVLPEGNHTFIVEQLSIGQGATLDIRDGALAIEYAGASPVAELESLVRTGFNGGDFLGTGISSSTAAAAGGDYAVGIADNASLSEPFGSSGTGVPFAGVDVLLESVLIRRTHRADFDLDGRVGSSDAAIFGTHYQEGAPASWAAGDIDLDGLFTFNDAAIFGTYYDEFLPPL